MKLSLTFLGGAGTVTGSKHLLGIGERKLLIDCGLFQGVKDQRLLNWARLPVDASTIHAVILTHAHLDHTGYLPLLIKQGFKGPIYCSEPTAALTQLILLDAAKIQEEDAEHANAHGYSKHQPALPLYKTEDAEAVFPYLKTLQPSEWYPILSPSPEGAETVELRFSNSGHILGSTFVELRITNGNEKKVIVFTGDLGRDDPPTLKPRVLLKDADYLVVESTYGDRRHPLDPAPELLARIINKTINRYGHVLIPTFAIGRTQDILHILSTLKAGYQIPDVPIYLDSPMADRATSVFDYYPVWHRLSSPDLKKLSKTFEHISTPIQSQALALRKDPSIVLAGSGMLTGGRIRRHLEARLPHERNSVILTGFQASGTLGRYLKEGATEVKLFGKYVPVRAEVCEISSLSAHADQYEILNWIDGFQPKPEKIFIVHGESHAADGLRVRIFDRFKINAHVAKMDEVVEL